MKYDVISAESADGGEVRISFGERVDPSEWTVVAERNGDAKAKVYKGSGTLTTRDDGETLVVPSLFGGRAFRVWLSRNTTLAHDYDSTASDAIDDATIDAELKELRKAAEEQAAELNRTLRVPEGDAETYLPSAPNRAGKVLTFDSDGNPVADLSAEEVLSAARNMAKAIESAKAASASELAAKASAESASKSAKEAEGYASRYPELLSLLENEVQARESEDIRLSETAAEALSAHNSDDYAHSGIFRKFMSIESLRNGFETQTVFGYDPMTGTTTGNNIYLTGDCISFLCGGNIIDMPTNGGTLALLSDVAAETSTRNTQYDYLNTRITAFGTSVDASLALKADSSALHAKCTLMETDPGTDNNNANGYGYVGTLRNLGAWGGSVNVEQLRLWRRANTGGATGTVWARIVKANAEGTGWIVAAQSKASVSIDGTAFGGEMAFEMEAVAGVTPPSADERIAIVFVSSADADAGASDGAIGFRTVDGSGALSNALPSRPPVPGGQSGFRPKIGLRFAAMDSPDAPTDSYSRTETDELLSGKVSAEAMVNFAMTNGAYVVPRMTTTVAGIGMLGTAAITADSTAGMIGLTADGRLSIRFATETTGGVFKAGGNGLAMTNGVLSLKLRGEHSGMNFESKGLYIQTGSDAHPTHGECAPVVTDTLGKLGVPDASASGKGAVQIASGLDDSGAVSVLTAAQVNTALSGYVSNEAMGGIVDGFNAALIGKADASALSALESRVAALEGAGNG